jgi:hypothetical protein
MLRAIVAGERAPPPLAALRPERGQKDADERALALTGPWRAEPLFVLKQALARCDFSTAQLSAGARQLARACAVRSPDVLTPRLHAITRAPR